MTTCADDPKAPPGWWYRFFLFRGPEGWGVNHRDMDRAWEREQAQEWACDDYLVSIGLRPPRPDPEI